VATWGATLKMFTIRQWELRTSPLFFHSLQMSSFHLSANELHQCLTLNKFRRHSLLSSLRPMSLLRSCTQRTREEDKAALISRTST
jgi:hypothetical protein